MKNPVQFLKRFIASSTVALLLLSAATVPGIMATIKGALPAAAKKAAVQAIASKWELNYQSPGLEAVDVTDDMD